MPKRAKEMTAAEVRRLVDRVVKSQGKPGWYAVGGVVGLGIDIGSATAQSWLLRVVDVSGKRRAFGLGSFPSVTLDMARDAARTMRAQVLAGTDPVAERRVVVEARRAEQAAVAARLVTFKKAAEGYIEANEAGWSNPKHAQQWRNTLVTYAYPKLGDTPVSAITTADVLTVLEPIWTAKNETATRVRQRIEAVLDAAKAKGQRTGDNPAAWKGCLDALLPKPGKVKKVEHHASLAWKDIPDFIARLRGQAGVAARMLEFSILCASRSGEVRGATWDEIDLGAGLWTIPAARMKAKREHRVPLSPQAVELLRALPRSDDQPLVFPAPRGGEFSDAAMGALLERMGVPVTQHGFRSSFRDWCAASGKPRDLAERALAHAVEDSTEAAYYRDTLVEQRRPLMGEWATYCRSKPTAEVVSIEAARVA